MTYLNRYIYLRSLARSLVRIHVCHYTRRCDRVSLMALTHERSTPKSRGHAPAFTCRRRVLASVIELQRQSSRSSDVKVMAGNRRTKARRNAGPRGTTSICSHAATWSFHCERRKRASGYGPCVVACRCRRRVAAAGGVFAQITRHLKTASAFYLSAAKSMQRPLVQR